MQVLKASLAYFALVFGLGFILGSVRVTLVVPRIGQRNAELLETPFMLAGIFLAAQFIITNFTIPHTILTHLSVGLLALSSVILAEIIMVVVLQRSTVRQYFKSRDPVSGGVYILLLIIFALMPLIMM